MGVNQWQQYIIQGVTYGMLLTAFGLASLFIEENSRYELVGKVLGSIALLAAPVVLMRSLRKIL